MLVIDLNQEFQLVPEGLKQKRDSVKQNLHHLFRVFLDENE
jgi:hypothetical protein